MSEIYLLDQIYYSAAPSILVLNPNNGYLGYWSLRSSRVYLSAQYHCVAIILVQLVLVSYLIFLIVLIALSFDFVMWGTVHLDGYILNCTHVFFLFPLFRMSVGRGCGRVSDAVKGMA